MYDIEKMKEDLKENVSPFRYQHSLMVAEEARKLADYYKEDPEKSYVAGLIHDIAKDFKKEEREDWMNRYHMKEELYKEKYQSIIHANIGALVAKEWYHIEEDISRAIEYHTIGNKEMNTFDKIIFLADKLARKKKTPFLEKLEALTYENLDQALIYYFKITKKELEERGFSLHKDSLELLKKLKEKETINEE